MVVTKSELPLGPASNGAMDIQNLRAEIRPFGEHSEGLSLIRCTKSLVGNQVRAPTFGVFNHR